MNVKWGRAKFDEVEVNTEEPPVVFKARLYSLTGVQPDRQKVMVKGGTLKVRGASGLQYSAPGFYFGNKRHKYKWYKIKGIKGHNTVNLFTYGTDM